MKRKLYDNLKSWYEVFIYSSMQNIIDLVNNKTNIALLAPGGTGKTFLIKQIAEYFISIRKRVCCTAPTGIAAVNLSQAGLVSSTIHRWSGIGLGQESKETLLSKILMYRNAVERWYSTDILIIDEISMVGASLFDKLNFIGKKVRKEPNLVFGGILLILCGDFLQLAPVNDEWVFKSKTWVELQKQNFQIVKMTIPKRYDDIKYYNFLKRIRIGQPRKKDVEFLNSRVVAYQTYLQNAPKDELEIKPTILYSRKMDVEFENKKQLDKLTTPIHTFLAVDVFTPFKPKIKPDFYTKILDEAISDTIVLKVGAQVMLKVNFDVDMGLANGSRGVVTNIFGHIVQVKFRNGIEQMFEYNKWSQEDNEGRMTRSQIPFILAWSLTVHKCQGTTLDYAVCDIGHTVFCPGQAYVALSRIRDSKGIFISEFTENSIKTDVDALVYSNDADKIALTIDNPFIGSTGYKPMIDDEYTIGHQFEIIYT